MDAGANQNIPSEETEEQADAISISETIWGYIIRKGGNASQKAAWGEIAAILASISFGIAAYCQWLLPGTINSIDVLPFKIVGTLIFFVFAFLNYSIARKGLLYEAQIDVKRGALGMARRNRDGVSSLVEGYPFSDIESIYIKQSNAFAADRLFIQPTSRPKPILVASGPADELEDLHRRLVSDVNPRHKDRQSASASRKDGKSGKRGADAIAAE